MSIRSGAKALILRENDLLLNRCRRENGSVYYDLPGGGQHQYETLEDAVLREVREETGCTVRILRFAALSEEIRKDPALMERFPDYTHRLMHIFLAEPVSWSAPTETDQQMEAFEWVPLERLNGIELFPHGLAAALPRILAGETLWLGSEVIGGRE